MKVDLGFWDIHGNYIEDIQEINEMELKVYTSRKTNEAGQRAIDCLDYCCLPDINETCTRILNAEDKFLPCKVRFGEVCEHFRAGIGTRLYKEN